MNVFVRSILLTIGCLGVAQAQLISRNDDFLKTAFCKKYGCTAKATLKSGSYRTEYKYSLKGLDAIEVALWKQNNVWVGGTFKVFGVQDTPIEQVKLMNSFIWTLVSRNISDDQLAQFLDGSEDKPLVLVGPDKKNYYLESSSLWQTGNNARDFVLQIGKDPMGQ